MKGLALGRKKTKDAYDIWFCLRNHPEGLDDLIEKFKPYKDAKLVKESLLIISDKFESTSHIGPSSVADFLELSDSEKIEEIRLDAYMRVDYLLKGLGVR